MPRIEGVKKVLLLGSGGIKIGEAGEFDYSGSQAIKALKEEGVDVVLINPNIATIQTDERLAKRVYFLPVNADFAEQVIAKEGPDGIMLGFGGQTALNCGVELKRRGVLEKYSVRVLGTPVDAIECSEDRELFENRLHEIGVRTPKSRIARSKDEAIAAGDEIGYPVIVRSAYALGGLGSGVAFSKDELLALSKRALTTSQQLIICEYLKNWKEVEYEVVRDCYDNCITVCNMENFDPLGIHTGESIVVAPSQTLTNREYHKLRDLSISIIRNLGVIGECNIQFALDPESEDYRVIEVNARLSRSSALASKATGYPLAFVAAKLALGYSLVELKNSITAVTTACFEPALDYVVVKVPRWDLKKFRKASNLIGSSMKSVGEVMAIGTKFEEALQKALRMVDSNFKGLTDNGFKSEDIESELSKPTDKRVFAIAQAVEDGMPVDKIHALSGVDRWFIYKIKNIISIDRRLRTVPLEREMLIMAKQHGFSDNQIALACSISEEEVMAMRDAYAIHPAIKQIDTLAAEYPAQTNYLYLTYNAMEDDIKPEKGSVIVLGSGAYRIGSSVEFDWCCVNAVVTLKELGYKTTMINNNPETVSTDYDVCDRLYFEELSFETVREIYIKEQPHGMVLSSGGQTPNNLAMKCHRHGLMVMGTSPLSIDNAENRFKFSRLLDELGISQPQWKELTNTGDAKGFADKVGYPVLVRPSYVLSGAAMSIAFNDTDLTTYLQKAVDISPEHPVVISKFITEAKEIELDAVAANGELVVYAITEHVENAGVHSGDATMVLPAQKAYTETRKRIKTIGGEIAAALNITGPFNIQFLAKDNEVMVIECNLRASRSFPFVSKTFKVNFIDLAIRAMLGRAEQPQFKEPRYVAVKAPQFSFSRIIGADPIITVEMSSTGEVACFGDDVHEAFLKALLSAGFRLPEKGRGILVSISGDQQRYRFLDEARLLHEMGFKIFATEHTAEFFNNNGIPSEMVYKISEEGSPNVLDMLSDRGFDLVINIPRSYSQHDLDDKYVIRRLTADLSIPLVTNLQLASLVVQAMSAKRIEDLHIKAWDEY